jgi:hypothetical protein
MRTFFFATALASPRAAGRDDRTHLVPGAHDRLARPLDYGAGFVGHPQPLGVVVEPGLDGGELGLDRREQRERFLLADVVESPSWWLGLHGKLLVGGRA